MGRSNRNGHVKLSGLTSSTSKSGERYYYHRPTRTPLGKGPIDSPEFLERYAAAAKTGKPVAKPRDGSLASIVAATMKSPTWERYSVGYRGILDREFRALVDAYGGLPFASVQSKHIRADISKLAPNPANARLKAWRVLCGLAFDRGWHDADPSQGIKKPKAPKTSGHAPWTAEQIDEYRDRWAVGTVQRLCFEVLWWSAARTVDAVSLSPSMNRSGVMTFTQRKTGGLAYVPWTAPLPTWADQSFIADRQHLLSCLPKAKFTYLETHMQRPRSAKGLSNLISAGAKSAGFHAVAHGLRKSRLTAIAEAGGSVHAIMSWGGHKSLSEAQEYIDSADRRRSITGNLHTRQSIVHTQEN